MEAEPYAGNWAIRMTPAERKSIRRKIIAGGHIADTIRLLANSHHEAHEIPEAEEQMRQDLRSLEQPNGKQNQKAGATQKKAQLSFWQRIVAFLRHLLIP